MNLDARERARVRNPVLLFSSVAWILLVLNPWGHAGMVHGPTVSMGAVLAMNPPGLLAGGWVLMLVAMMLPALIPPLSHIRACSFAHRRVRSTALFLGAYAIVWMAAGLVLAALQVAIALPAVAIIALVWQCSPWKQRCLNRCHGHRELSAFGPKADRDALRFGMTHGLWCAGSCWALMLLTMVVTKGHIPAMAAATLLISSERFEHPAPPCWRVRGLGRVKRMGVAQGRIRFEKTRAALDLRGAGL